MKCAPKKFENPARLFDPSVFVQTDTCQICVRFGMCVNLSVFNVGKAVGICADGHVSDMRALRDVCKFIGDVGKAVGVPVGDCGTIP